MPHYFRCAGERVALDESADDVGLRFGHDDGPERSREAFRCLVRAADPAGLASFPARRYGRFMLLHDSNASTAPVEAVVNVLPRRLASRVARTMPVFVERESGLKLVATEQILVGFRPGTSADRRRRLLASLGLIAVRPSEFDSLRYIVVPASVKRASRTLDLANRLAEADDVVSYAAPNFLSEVRKKQVNDPRFSAQWHLHNRGQGRGLAAQDVRALGAWKLVGGGNPRIVIAIVDDGVDLDHPDLRANIWKNPARGAPDRHGRDFLDDDDPFNPRPKVFVAPYDDTDTNDIHGTPCAGVAAAVGNNNAGVTGIAWGCRLLAVKVLAGPDLAPSDRIADAIRYASLHADVLSCSWGAAPHPDIESAIGFAASRGRSGLGALVCAATGNEGARRIAFPADAQEALAIGACNDRGRRSRYSNYGPGLALLAPSNDDDAQRQGITTTDVSLRGKGYSSGAYCDDFGGTSSATPLAAGVAALVLSADPTLASTEVRDVLTSTAEKIDAARAKYRNGYSTQYGFGRVNAEAAVAAALQRSRRRR